LEKLRKALTLLGNIRQERLDWIKQELRRRNITGINAAQALLIYHIGDQELAPGEMRTHAGYLGTNPTHTLKQLVNGGFLTYRRSCLDRRKVLLKLTAKGQDIRVIVEAVHQHQACLPQLAKVGVDAALQLHSERLPLPSEPPTQALRPCPQCGHPLVGDALPGLSLSRTLRGVLTVISRRSPHGISAKDIADWVYAADENGGPEGATKAVHCHISRLRLALQPHGITIKNVHGLYSVVALSASSQSKAA
jgi:DNA-binding MarR family transcriptional regulator